MLHFLMLNYIKVALCDVSLFVMLNFLLLHYFNTALSDVALFDVNVPVFHIVLVAVAPVAVAIVVSLFNVALF